VTAPMLPAAPDTPADVSGSSWLIVAALVVAVLSGFAPAPFNGLSVLASALVVVALVRRHAETARRRS